MAILNVSSIRNAIVENYGVKQNLSEVYAANVDQTIEAGGVTVAEAFKLYAALPESDRETFEVNVNGYFFEAVEIGNILLVMGEEEFETFSLVEA